MFFCIRSVFYMLFIVAPCGLLLSCWETSPNESPTHNQGSRGGRDASNVTFYTFPCVG